MQVNIMKLIDSLMWRIRHTSYLIGRKAVYIKTRELRSC